MKKFTSIFKKVIDDLLLDKEMILERLERKKQKVIDELRLVEAERLDAERVVNQIREAKKVLFPEVKPEGENKMGKTNV